MHNGELEADNRLVFNLIMSALLINTRRTNEIGATVWPLWAGQSDDVPSAWNGQTFAANHNHYLTTNSAELEGAWTSRSPSATSLNMGTELLPALQLMILANPAEGDYIRSFRAGTVAADESVSKYYFIPSESAPADSTDQQIIGATAPANGRRSAGGRDRSALRGSPNRIWYLPGMSSRW